MEIDFHWFSITLILFSTANLKVKGVTQISHANSIHIIVNLTQMICDYDTIYFLFVFFEMPNLYGLVWLSEHHSDPDLFHSVPTTTVLYSHKEEVKCATDP